MTGDAALMLLGDVDSLDARSTSDATLRDRAADAAMDRHAGGDASAFAELYDLLAPRLHRFLIRQVRNAAQAEDLLQQAMLQIHCARASYISGARVVPWAFAIARNLVIDAHRRRRRDAMFDTDESSAERPSVEPMPDELLQTKQAALAIERVLASLPESHRVTFELLKYDGLSLVETAEVLGITVGAAKVRAHRTYAMLRAAVCGEGPTKR